MMSSWIIFPFLVLAVDEVFLLVLVRIEHIHLKAFLILRQLYLHYLCQFLAEVVVEALQLWALHKQLVPHPYVPFQRTGNAFYGLP